jgi:uncharacterized protein (DUF2141 family)
MRSIIFWSFLLSFHLVTLGQITIKIRVENVEENGGKIHLSVFNSESSYKAREFFVSFALNATDELIYKELSLPNGQYVFSIYQDSNGNGKLDTNFIGIPSEKFGFSNYKGNSAPGGFNRHKVEINGSCREVVVVLFKI